MDIATLGGLVAGIGLIAWGILANGLGMGPYINAPSIIIVVGGTFAAHFIAYPLSKALGIGGVISRTISNSLDDTATIIAKILELANTARREGLLALEEGVADISDEFLKKGVGLIVDGTDPELIKSILETEMSYISDRHTESRGMLDNLGAMAPAFGMVGTLIGLVAMLQQLDDPSTIGPSMAVALLTTFYGSVLANLFFIPMSKKLEVRNSEEVIVKEIMIEGLLSIQAGENPRIIEEKLKAFLSPKIRKTIETASEGAQQE